MHATRSSRATRVIVAVALSTLVAAACSGDDGQSDANTATTAPSSVETTTTTTTPPPEPVRLNDVQVLGSHNSYHLQPAEGLFEGLAALSPELAESIEYSHLPLTDQLEDFGIRQFEIDVFADPDGGLYASRAALPVLGLPAESGIAALDEPGFKVLHTQDFDFETTCLTFVACLTEIDAWSRERPDHLPIMIMIEAKEETIAEAAAGAGVSLEGIDLPFAIPPKMDETLFGDLEAEILSVVDRDRIITPDEVRGEADTLEAAVLTDGWPELGAARGRMMLALVNTGGARDVYRAPSETLEGRLMFTSSNEGSPDAAFVRVDDPIEGADRIAMLVRAGYLVRTRADVPTEDARTGDTTRRDAALASGAHYLSTDYYIESPAFGTGYSVALPGGAVGRCITARAPETCPPGDVEAG